VAGLSDQGEMKPYYGVILADPPWPYSDGGHGNGRARDHYPLMKIKDIFDLPIKHMLCEDAVMILWSTWPQLDNAFKLIGHWGFEFVTGFPWLKTYDPPFCDLFGETIIKPTYGTGCWVRGCSEPILIGKHGNAKHPKNGWMGLISERMNHSRKPDTIYQYAESFPGPYLELFARRRREGWDLWGNELPNDVLIPA